MARADDFRTLAHDCSAAYDARIASITSIKNEVNNLKSEAANFISETRKEINKMKSGVASLLNTFKGERYDAARVWRELVTTLQKKRCKEIPKSRKR